MPSILCLGVIRTIWSASSSGRRRQRSIVKPAFLVRSERAVRVHGVVAHSCSNLDVAKIRGALTLSVNWRLQAKIAHYG